MRLDQHRPAVSLKASKPSTTSTQSTPSTLKASEAAIPAASKPSHTCVQINRIQPGSIRRIHGQKNAIGSKPQLQARARVE
mmetsp:Transcript_59781/g.129501  ORF Transcript_59781/g.129501 Transcript_59781/m.129501 type:complete len:81 (+) Transcript_59781:137-379(+)